MTAILAYLLIAAFFALEFFVRQGGEAKSFKTGIFDRGSTALISLAFGIGVILSPVLNFLRFGQAPFGDIAGWIGVALMAGGLALRWWAMRTLSHFYTRTLLVTDQHQIVESGPYRLIRHPGYLGTLIVWVAAGLAMQNEIVFLINLLLMSLAYGYRIRHEEAMLLETFGADYRRYMARTRLLIPYIF